jgi:aryl-alcohol dehydrogenase-like predicted oxidoreductase
VGDSTVSDRREFLGAVAGFTAAALTARGLFAADERSGDMIYRQLGSTGERVSAIGLGGYHIGTAPGEQDSIRLIRAAIDRGIDFLDNSWDYMDGKCEVWMGKALRDGYRRKVFLMTKFDGRTRASTARQIDESLQRLRTDHVDLMQFHENIRLEDPDRFFNEGPAEVLLEAKKAGKIRYIGFTGHKDPLVHLRMLELAQAHKFHFDAAQMPLNTLDAQFRSFSHQVVPKLVEQWIAVLAMKTMAGSTIVQNKLATAIECLHYALSLPTSVAITGIPDACHLSYAQDQRSERWLHSADAFRS